MYLVIGVLGITPFSPSMRASPTSKKNMYIFFVCVLRVFLDHQQKR